MTPGPEHAAFLTAIRADPEDDTVRLVFADWLDEHGEEDRARLIRLQCEAEQHRRNLWPSLAREPDQEAQEIINRHPEWTDALYRHGAHKVIFGRGLIEGVEISDAAFVEHGEALLRDAPPSLHRLKIFYDPVAQVNRPPPHTVEPWPLAERLAETLHLGRIDTLDLDWCGMGRDNMRILVSAPAMASIRDLRLNSCFIDNEAVAALAASEHCGGLQRLDLSHNHRVGPESIESLARASFAHQITHLNLGGTRIRDEGVETLARCGRFGNLRRLQLSFQKDIHPDTMERQGITRHGLMMLASGRFSPDMQLELRGYEGSFAHFQGHPYTWQHFYLGAERTEGRGR